MSQNPHNYPFGQYPYSVPFPGSNYSLPFPTGLGTNFGSTYPQFPVNAPYPGYQSFGSYPGYGPSNPQNPMMIYQTNNYFGSNLNYQAGLASQRGF